MSMTVLFDPEEGSPEIGVSVMFDKNAPTPSVWVGHVQEVYPRRWKATPFGTDHIAVDGFGSKTAAANYLLALQGFVPLRYRKGKR